MPDLFSRPNSSKLRQVCQKRSLTLLSSSPDHALLSLVRTYLANVAGEVSMFPPSFPFLPFDDDSISYLTTVDIAVKDCVDEMAPDRAFDADPNPPHTASHQIGMSLCFILTSDRSLEPCKNMYGSQHRPGGGVMLSSSLHRARGRPTPWTPEAWSLPAHPAPMSLHPRTRRRVRRRFHAQRTHS